MTRNNETTASLPSRLMSSGEIAQGIRRLGKRISELEAFSPTALSAADAKAEALGLNARIDDALVRTFGQGTTDYLRFASSSKLSWAIRLGGGTDAEEIQDINRSKTRAIMMLKTAVVLLEEQADEVDGAKVADHVDQEVLSATRRIFLVHGHDIATRESVARFLERCDFEPVILHEQASSGRTIIEKFEAHADVGFAVVLLTPDDEMRSASGRLRRARQNVVLELGYFIGKLGRGRVCALKQGDVELPSDILGVVWTELDTHGAWKQSLAREINAAGYLVDWNKVMNC